MGSVASTHTHTHARARAHARTHARTFLWTPSALTHLLTWEITYIHACSGRIPPARQRSTLHKLCGVFDRGGSSSGITQSLSLSLTLSHTHAHTRHRLLDTMCTHKLACRCFPVDPHDPRQAAGRRDVFDKGGSRASGGASYPLHHWDAAHDYFQKYFCQVSGLVLGSEACPWLPNLCLGLLDLLPALPAVTTHSPPSPQLNHTRTPYQGASQRRPSPRHIYTHHSPTHIAVPHTAATVQGHRQEGLHSRREWQQVHFCHLRPAHS